MQDDQDITASFRDSVISAPKSSTLRDLLSQPFVHVILIITLGFVIYMSTSDVPFVLDDTRNIIDDPALRDMRYFTDTELINKALVSGNIDEHFKSRIFCYFTFALNYKLHGLEVQGYHVFNLLVHLANSAMVYLLVLLTTKAPWFRRAAHDTEDPTVYRVSALFASLLFVSHPVQIEAVTFITQRFASLATMFCLLSLVLYIKARLLTESTGRRAMSSEQRVKRYVPVAMLYAVSLLCAVLAMKTKQIAFTMPVVIALYEAMFFDGNARKRLVYLAPLLLTMLIIPLATLQDRRVLTDIGRLETSIRGGYVQSEAVGYLLTQFRVIVTYLRLLVLPINQNLDYDYPVYHDFLNPQVFLSFILIAVIFMAGVYLYRRSRNTGIRNRQWLRLAAFGIFWFFITLSVESSIIPLADLIFEHRLYLPSIGFSMLVVSAASMGKRRLGNTGAKAIALFLAFAVLALSVAAFQRNQIWGDKIRLYTDMVQKSPDKYRVHYQLGIAYEKRGYIDHALNEYLTALKMNPVFCEAHNDLGVIYYKQGHIDKAINEYLAALKINPDSYGTHYNLGIAYTDLAGTHNDPGNAYERNGYIIKAIEEFTAALKIKPDFAEAHYKLWYAYTSIGRMNEAASEFSETLRINPQTANPHQP